MNAPDTSKLTPLQRAVLAMKELRTRLDKAEAKVSGPIAVIGLGCRLPGGIDHADDFWRCLEEGRDMTSEMPNDRWPVDRYFDADPDVPGKVITRRGGFLDQIDRFDAGLFGISPREARSLDPQQRLLLEVVWTSLEHAGLPPDKLRHKRTGVYVGIGIDDYVDRTLRSGDPERMDAYSGSGIGLCFASGRISYVLGSHGPSLSLDTACSSSMVAMHLACQSLRQGECDLALAGGVNLIMSPEPSIFLSKARALAPDGRCKTFDASADGYSRAEGCVVLAFKRLEDAQQDGDRVLAVIRGSALNHDGPSSGLTVPNGKAQVSVLEAALANAGLTADSVDYVEAHGTGTALGDPIELRALQQVYGAERKHPLWVGSVKTNVGHLETGASVVSVAKTVLALHHRRIPPHLHFNEPTPHFDWRDSQLRVPTTLTDWPQPTHGMRTAGVSAFGLSGTNGHLILEEAPQTAPIQHTTRPHALLKLSAQSQEALADAASRYLGFLDRSETSFDVIASAANHGRGDLNCRAGVVAKDRAQAITALTRLARGEAAAGLHTGRRPAEGQPELVFLFSGQGSQHQGMGKTLDDHFPAFRETIDRCAAHLAPDLDLRALLFDTEDDLLAETRLTQPVLFAFEMALFETWRSLGVEPDVVLGHSLGEVTAACAAGVFTLEEGLTLAKRRGEIIQNLRGDYGMLAVEAGREMIEAYLENRPALSLAAINSPTQSVVSGPVTALTNFAVALKAEEIRNTRLSVSHGFHSDQMDALNTTLPDVFAGIQCRKPRIPLISNLTGAPVTDAMLKPEYWVRHARETVRFSDSLQHLFEKGYGCFVEIGPKPMLLAMARNHRGADEMRWIASCRPAPDELKTFKEAVAALYTAGFDIHWSQLQPKPAQWVDLPLYPFQGERYWLERPVTRPEPSEATHLESLLDALDTTDFSEEERTLLPKLMQRMRDQNAATLLKSKRDHILEETWEALAPAQTKPNERQWLLLETEAGPGLDLMTRLEALGSTVVRQVRAEELTECMNHFDTTQPLTVVWLVGEQRETGFSREAQTLVALAHALNALDGDIHLITICRHDLQRTDSAALAPTAIIGAFRSLRQELPGILSRLITLEDTETAGETLLNTMLHPAEEPQIAIREGRALVPRLTPAATTPRKLSCSAEGIYVVTGGTGALGLEAAATLIDVGARHLHLIARRSPTTKAAARIETWRARGIRVVLSSVDLGDPAAVKAWFETIDAQSIRGVIHTAGIGGFQPTETLTEDDWNRIFAAKVHGAWMLHEHLDKNDLDFFILYGSIAAAWGSKSQVHYAAANACLEGLAQLRRAQGLRANTLVWGPWKDGGMASNETLVHLDRLGLKPWTPSEGRVLLRDHGIHSVVLADVDWNRLKVLLENQTPQPLLASLGETQAAPKAEVVTASIDPSRWLTDPWDTTCTEVFEYVRGILARLLAIPEDQLGEDTNIAYLGLDSLMIADLRTELQTTLGNAPTNAQLFREMSLKSLAELVLEIHRSTQEAEPVAAGASDGWLEGEL